MDYWRLALSAGDKIDITYHALGQPNCGNLYLFAPTVTDFNIRQAQPVSSASVTAGTQAVQLASPFNGTGTLAISIDRPSYFQDLSGAATTNYPPLASPIYGGCGVVTPYSMTVVLEHLTQLTLGRVPSYTSSPRSRFRLVARLTSPAGTPHGSCLIERVVLGVPTRVANVAAVEGSCSAKVSNDTRAPVKYRVTFHGNEWQTSQATTGVIRAK